MVKTRTYLPESESVKIKKLKKNTDSFFKWLLMQNDIPSNVEIHVKENYISFDFEKNFLKLGEEFHYSKDLKDLLLILHYYYPAALKEFRKICHPPTKEEITEWTSNESFMPGFIEQVFAYLKGKIRSREMVSKCCLSLGTMDIAERSVYCEETGSYLGEVNLGGVPTVGQGGCSATHVVVFYLVLLDSHFSVPVGYFFTGSPLCPSLVAQLIRTCVVKLNSVGMHVVSFAYAGEGDQWISVFKILGCKFEGGLSSVFSVNSNKYEIYVLIDMSCLLNRCLDVLARYGKVKTKNGFVEFKFLKKLAGRIREIKSGGILDVSQKSYLQRISIKVKSQILSTDIADALFYLLTNKDPQYCESKCTIEFIRNITTLGDMLNCKSKFGKGNLKPVSTRSFNLWEKKLDSIFYFLSYLKIEDTPILCHNEKMFALGLLCNIASLRTVVMKYFTGNRMDHFLTSQISTEPLNSFFSTVIENADDPFKGVDCARFREVIKSVLWNAGVDGCPPSSVNPPILIAYFQKEMRSMMTTTDDDPSNPNYCKLRYLVSVNNLNGVCDLYSHRLSCLIEYLIEDLNCPECCDILLSNLSLDVTETYFDNWNHLTLLIRSIENKRKIIPKGPNWEKKITNSVLNEVLINYNLFSSHSLMSDVGEELHQLQLVRFITKKYIKLKTKSAYSYLF